MGIEIWTFFVCHLCNFFQCRPRSSKHYNSNFCNNHQVFFEFSNDKNKWVSKNAISTSRSGILIPFGLLGPLGASWCDMRSSCGIFFLVRIGSGAWIPDRVVDPNVGTYMKLHINGFDLVYKIIVREPLSGIISIKHMSNGIIICYIIIISVIIIIYLIFHMMYVGSNF